MKLNGKLAATGLWLLFVGILLFASTAFATGPSPTPTGTVTPGPSPTPTDTMPPGSHWIFLPILPK